MDKDPVFQSPTSIGRNCVEHVSKPVTFVCYDCNKLICGKCVTSTHNGHIMEELSDAMPGIKEKLLDSISKIEKDQRPQVQKCIELTEQRLIENVKCFQNVVMEIKAHGQKCKEEIDVLIDEYVKVCEQFGKENTELLIAYMADQQTIIKELTKQIDLRKQALLTGNDVERYDILREVQTFDPIDWPSLHITQFHPGGLLKEAFGKLITTEPHMLSTGETECPNNCKSETPSMKPPSERSAGSQSKKDKPEQSSGKKSSTEQTEAKQNPVPNPSVDKIKSTRPPRRPISTGKSRSTSLLNKINPHFRPQPRPPIFKRRNSLETPSLSHRFLTARPSTSSDIRPLITVTSSQQKPAIKATVLSQFQSPCPITCICPTPEGHAWTCHEQSRIITMLDVSGNIRQTVTCKANINDICLSPITGKLWYCTWKCKVVEFDPSTNSQLARFQTDAWPRCLCVTDSEQILIGMENKITLYTSSGHALLTTTTEESDVILPTRISRCPLTGNIAFLEKNNKHCEDENNGHVVVLDSNLKIKFRYKGQSTRDLVYFDPFDLKYDEKGHLLIGDFTSHTLDMINGTGNHIRTLLTDTESAQAVGIMTGDVMWAAFGSSDDISQVKVLQY